MRIVIIVSALAGLSVWAASLPARADGWSGDQQNETGKQVRDDAKDTLNDIGNAEQGGPGQQSISAPSAGQVLQRSEDLMNQGSSLIDNLPHFP